MDNQKTINSQEASKRPLSTIGATSLVVGNMIGVGMFTTTGFLAEAVGDPVLMLGFWLLGGVLALCGAFVYGELGAMMPRAGGEYVYLSSAFHPLIGFLSGWVSFLVGFSAPIALTSYAFAIYFNAAYPELPIKVIASLLIVILTVVHAVNVIWSSRLHTLLTVFKVLLIVSFVIAAFGVGNGEWNNFTVYSQDIEPQFALALVLVSFSYLGWNVASYVGGEIKNPRKSIPQSLIWGTCIVTFLFIILNMSFVYAAPLSELAVSPEKIAYIAATNLFGDVAGETVSLLIAFALISSVSAMIMAGSRVYMTMAEDGLFFKSLASKNKYGSPWVSLIAQCVVALFLLLTSTFIDLLTYIGVILSIFSGLTIIAAFRLRNMKKMEPRLYKAFGWPLTPILYLLLVSWMAVVLIIERPLILVSASLTIALGVVLYFYMKRRT